MVQLLLVAKVLEKYKLFGAYHLIETDATRVHSFDYEPYSECPHIQKWNKDMDGIRARGQNFVRERV